MMLIRITIGLFLIAASAQATIPAIQVGDYLFLHARILDCGPQSHVVDFAEVLEEGEARFLNGAELSVMDKTRRQIADFVAKEIGKKTGRAPESLFVVVIEKADTGLIGMYLRQIISLRLASGKCPNQWSPVPRAPDYEPPVDGYNIKLAMASIE